MQQLDKEIEAARRCLDDLDRYTRIYPERPGLLLDMIHHLSAALKELYREREDLMAAGAKAGRRESRAADLFHIISDACLVTDPDGSILEANPAAAILLGSAPGILLGQRIDRFVAPGDAASFAARHRRVLVGEAVPAWELDLRQGGAVRSARATVTLCSDGRDSSACLIWLFRDITEGKNRDLELLIRDAALEASMNAVVIAGVDGRVTYANRAACAFFGVAGPECLVGERISGFLGDGDSAATLRDALFRDGIWQGEITGRKRDGSDYLLQVSVQLLSGGDGDPAYIVASGMDAAGEQNPRARFCSSENFCRTLLEIPGAALLIVGEDGTIAAVNAECERRFGFARRELEGCTLWDRFFSGSNRGVIREYLRLCRENPAYAPRDYPVSIIDAEGALRDVVLSVAALPGMQRYAVSLVDMTELRRLEAALKASEEKFREIVQRSFDVLFTCNEACVLTYVSPAIERITGYTPEDLIGHSFEDLILPSSKRHLEDAENTLRRGLPVEGLTLTIVRRDGMPCVIEINASPLGSGGVTTGVQGVCRDITDRMRAEAELKIKEMAIVSSVSAILLIDLEGVVEYVNQAFLRLWGYDPEDEVLGRPVATFWQHEQRADQVFSALRRDGTWVGEIAGVRKDGAPFDAQMSANVVTDEYGNSLCFVAYVVDISDRKRVEEALRSRNKQLYALNQIISASSQSSSSQEILESALAKTMDLLGFDAGIAYLTDEDRKRGYAACSRGVPAPFLAENHVIRIHHWPFNYVFVAGQPRYLVKDARPTACSAELMLLQELEVSSLACIPLVAESAIVGGLYVGSRRGEVLPREKRLLLETIGREVGSGILKGMLHKRLEAANHEANLYLDIMTHDIKNAGNVASLYCDILSDGLEGEMGLYVKRLRGSIRKSIGILANVSTIRRLHQEEVDVKPVHLDSVIREEVSQFPDLRFVYEGSSIYVEADDLLPEVFTNLIGNSVKFGGPEVEVRILVDEEDENVIVTIEDTGPGIPDDLKRSIFHRFERGNNPASGEGLGLYISRMLIERYGGRILVRDRVEGQPEAGATFSFSLRKADLSDEENPIVGR
ncbi:PAS domain S-box protein [Methanoculleus taiwanensis]|uniref:PAS domain S-box protein n=1 Tax=Methanoculleus taiwanensis TaxID=1550565 RepID=UPI0013E8CB92|nr:PAS domain S-box protein [Methanoculleus taiwanensis]